MDEPKSNVTHTPTQQHIAPAAASPAPSNNQDGRIKALTVLTVISLIIGLASLYFVFSINSKINGITGKVIDTGDQGSDVIPGDEKPNIVNVEIGNAPVEGDKNAPVTIIEFSDFQCPFCARFYSQTLPQIRENYVKTGKVKIVFKSFPLSFHENAQKAAEAALCAKDQGKFWEMHDKLFENSENLGVDNLKKIAKDLKLDTTKFNTCLDSGKNAAEVQSEFREGSEAGVSGTPSFFINGKLIVGAQPYSAFQQEIDAALAAAK